MSVFVLPVRVYYEDTDHGGVVYYANYLKFMERCRTEFLRECGLEQDVLITEHDLIFAVRRIEADYLQPAKFNDLLLVTAEVIKKSKVRIVFKQQVFKASLTRKQDITNKFMAGFFGDLVDSLVDSIVGNNEKLTGDSVLLCEAEVTIASLSASKMRPKRIPENIFKELMRER